MDDKYEAPAVADTTPVTEPLNTITNSERRITPAWRKQQEEE
jgi:hypothetical protein